MDSWRNVEIRECGESLVRLTGIWSLPWHAEHGVDDALSEVWLRVGVAKMLWEAEDYLPDDVRLLVLDAWRPSQLHQRLIAGDRQEIIERLGRQNAEPYLETLLDPPDLDPNHPAPSLTGGRVGVSLCDLDGRPLDMGSAPRELSERSLTEYFTSDDNPFHERRQTLIAAMTRAGFSSDRGAWWRFQFGTQMHHLLVGGPAIYGMVDSLPPGHPPISG